MTEFSNQIDQGAYDSVFLVLALAAALLVAIPVRREERGNERKENG